VVATLPDLLRLVAVPVFGYVAYRDVETRRVPNETWYPIAALAVVLLAWDAVSLFAGDAFAFERRLFAIRVAVSLGLVAPLAYLFWRFGAFGGADAKAFFVVALLFPTYPHYTLPWLGTLPVVETTLGVFSLSVLSNTVLVGLGYPLALGARNALTGHLSPAMFVGRPIRPAEAIDEYGSLLSFPDRRLRDARSLAELRACLAWRGLDLDALRMYLRWRDLDYDALRADPDRYRDPATLPAEPNPPGDGAIATDGGVEDPWGAAAFLDDIEGSAYGTDPETLRTGLDRLADDEVVWLSPGIPFLVPLFGGLLVALTFGDLLFGLLALAGAV
jgi:preflagellin peptidase FlaK